MIDQRRRLRYIDNQILENRIRFTHLQTSANPSFWSCMLLNKLRKKTLTEHCMQAMYMYLKELLR